MSNTSVKKIMTNWFSRTPDITDSNCSKKSLYVLITYQDSIWLIQVFNFFVKYFIGILQIFTVFN